MACCYIVVFVLGKLIKACETLDLEIGVQLADSAGANGKKIGEDTLTGSQDARSVPVITLSVAGMTCAACVSTLERALMAVEGVDRVKVSLPLQQAVISYGKKAVSTDDLIKVAEACGYDAEPGKRTPGQQLQIIRRTQELQRLRSSLSGICKLALVLFMHLWKRREFRSWNHNLGKILGDARRLSYVGNLHTAATWEVDS